jgi:hypothetical protein
LVDPDESTTEVRGKDRIYEGRQEELLIGLEQLIPGIDPQLSLDPVN